MIFGLGRKKDHMPAPVQMSPEAMSMLNQLAQGSPEGEPQHPSMAPSMDRDVDTGTSTAAAQGDTDMSPKEQRRQTRAKMKAAAIAKREEKDIARRRKRNAKARFSRAAYLREATGNARSSIGIAGVFLAITFIVPLVVNILFLLPATRSNEEIIEEVRALQTVVEQAQPILQAAIGRKNERQVALQDQLAAFVTNENATTALRQFISDLESRGAVLKSEASETVVNKDVGLAGLTGKSLTIEAKVDFLDYLLVRNRFVRAQPRVSLSEETIVATPGDAVIDVRLILMVPAQS